MICFKCAGNKPLVAGHIVCADCHGVNGACRRILAKGGECGFRQNKPNRVQSTTSRGKK